MGRNLRTYFYLYLLICSNQILLNKVMHVMKNIAKIIFNLVQDNAR